jgi:curved DNA-binding protein CbpA
MSARESLQKLLAWEEVLDDSSYYEILGVLEICDDAALRTAYHQFALSFHPDLFREEPEHIQESVRKIFQRGTEAYRVLNDRELRVKYDMALREGVRRLEDALLPRQSEPAFASASSRPLDELARSAGAKLSAQKAMKLIEKGELESAKTELERALEYDGNANPALKERLEALAVALYAGGG